MSEPELTKREFAAIQIMAGFAAYRGTSVYSTSDISTDIAVKSQGHALSEIAVKWADALMKELGDTDEL